MEIDSIETNQNNDHRLFCFVDGCFTTSARNKNLGFHQFPGNDDKRILRRYKNGTQKLVNIKQLWIEALNIHKEGTTVIGKMRVCSLHFSRKDFIISDEKNPYSKLKPTAIPRRNLPLRRNSKLTTRLHVRGFNRIKWRGRLAFQDLDVRVPSSKCRPHKNSKPTSPEKVSSEEKRNEKEGKEDEEEENCPIVEGFTLTETDLEQFDDLEVESIQTKNQITSELIIKEEPLSDVEQESDDWSEENIIAEVERTEKDQQVNDWQKKTSPITDQVITTQSVLEDLVSSGDEEEESRSTLRDRPCKSCGKRDCDGHPDSKPIAAFVCVVCNEIFQTPSLLDAHSTKHDEEMNVGGNSWHDDFVSRNPSKDLQCKICGENLATRTLLKEHVSRHVGDKVHVCQLCGRQFRHKVNLVVHVNAHSVVQEFKCPLCPMAFGMRVDLEDHRTLHLELEYKCAECGNGFASKRALWTHKQVHSRKTIMKKRRSGGVPKKGGGGLPCRVCNKVLSTKNTLREHMMIHSGEKPHECMLCGKLIRHKANFVIHVQSHTMKKMQQCADCDAVFSSKLELRKHRFEMDSNCGKFKCILCEATFRKEEGLMEHVEEAHGDKKGGDELGEYADLFQPHLLDGFTSLR